MTRAVKPAWLSRATFSAVPYTLVTSEAMLRDVLKDMDYPHPEREHMFGGNKDARAMCSWWGVDADWKAIVQIDGTNPDNHSPIDIAGALVHEAVHIWQRTMQVAGEDSPSKEFMAYGIEFISENLMREYSRQVFGSKK